MPVPVAARSKARVCGGSPAEIVGSNPTGDMEHEGVVCWGLWDELITCPEQFHRLWCVVVCDLETSWMRKPWPTGEAVAPKKEKNPSTLWETKFNTGAHMNMPILTPLKPVQYGPRLHIQFLQRPFQYYPPIYSHIFQIVCFAHVSTTQRGRNSSPPHVPHELPISPTLLHHLNNNIMWDQIMNFLISYLS